MQSTHIISPTLSSFVKHAAEFPEAVQDLQRIDDLTDWSRDEGINVTAVSAVQKSLQLLISEDNCAKFHKAALSDNWWHYV